MLYARLALAALALASVGAAPTGTSEKTMAAMSDAELSAKIEKVTAEAIQKREEAKQAKEAELDAIAERIAGKVHQARALADVTFNNNKDCSMSIDDNNGWTCEPAGCNPACTNKASSNPCFDKSSTTTCLLASPTAECEHVLMADLSPGDLVLGRDGATTVVAVQHKAVDTVAEMLTFHTAGGAVSMTPTHGIFVDGELIAAEDVKMGAALSTGAVERITKGEALIINAVTMDGTIVADGVLAASNPMWIASLTVDAPITRAIVNAVLYAAGDVDSVAAGSAKVVGTLAGAALIAKALRSRKSSSA